MFEIIIIAGIALVVVGPEKFPPFAKAVIKTFRELKTQIEETQREITKEIQPVQKELRELNKHKPEDYIDKITGGALTGGESESGSDFDYEYPYREHESTQQDKSEANTEGEGESEAESAESSAPEGTESFNAPSSEAPPTDTPDVDINLEPDGPDWDRYDAEQRAASGDGTD